MEKLTQKLTDSWRVLPEGKEELEQTTSLPALVRNLFPFEKGAIWCYNNFCTALRPEENERIYLCFDRVVCRCEVWLNDIFIATHLHSEESFSVDITHALKDGENRLAIRVEGFDPKCMPNYAQIYSYYTLIPMTGIYGNVTLWKKPVCKINDLHLRPDFATKTLSVTLSLENCGSPCDAQIEYCVLEKGEPVKTLCKSIAVGQQAADTAAFCFDTISPWSPDNPYLYDLVVSVKTNGKTETLKKRFGFKDLRVEDGYFVLNGKRIFLTCAHTFESKEAIIHAKTMGFKCLRYLTHMPPKEILDFCDEIGMLVYEECAAAWGMQDYEGMEKDMAAYLDNMLLRDRNHVSVGIWGIFNEQSGPNYTLKSSILENTKKVFDFAVNYLPNMRKLDDQRLILLSSGRWDARTDIGSFSNPLSNTWNYGWGKESPDAQACEFKRAPKDVSPYIDGLGDNHIYPTMPIQNDVRDFMRNIGKDTKPVFLSEYGVGYQLELYDLHYNLEKTTHPDHPRHAYYNVQIRHLEQWIEKYGLSKVYPTPRDFLMASINANAIQRRDSIDPIRANPKLCGYSLTSFTVGNEGVYFRSGGLVPGVVDAIRDSFAPLKWSIFMDSDQLYQNRPFEVELVLCNEDALSPGTYTAVVSVTGDDGVVFSEEASFVYPESKPLAASVLKVTVPGLQPGEYTFAVHVNGIIQPTCATKAIRVYDLEKLEKLSQIFYPIGDLFGIPDLLCKNGMRVAETPENADVIVVGSLHDADKSDGILKLAQDGKRVAILDCKFFDSANTSAQEFMQTIEFDGEAKTLFGNCIYVRNWLYHLDSYIVDKSVFTGIAGIGIASMELFREVYPDHYFTDTAKPQRTVCASFGSGLFAKDHCIAAFTMGEFAFGRGSVFVNAFKLLETAGKNPVADRILYNLFKSFGC